MCCIFFAEYLARFGCYWIVLLASIIHSGALVISFLNMPFDSSTDNAAYLNPPITGLAILASFLLGFGDACYNTSLCTIIGKIFEDNSAAGFAILKFFQTFCAAVALLYSNQCSVQFQVIILIIACFVGTLCFCMVELQARSEEEEEEEEEEDEQPPTL